MLDKPDLPESLLLARAQEEFGIPLAHLTFLPIGADFNTAVYHAETTNGAACFVKLRKGPFNEITVDLPKYLHDQGFQAVIAPLETTSHQLSTSLGEYRLILYPFIAGQDGYMQDPTARQWLDFGAALRAIHIAQLPSTLRQRIPQETYSPRGRELVRQYQAQVENTAFAEPVAAKMAACMRQKREEIRQVVDRADQLAQVLQQRSLELVLCHADIHPGNLHLTPNGALFIVDWDNPIFAPKEHDLALIGGCSTWSSLHQVELFYQGYGSAPVDRAALAYYRLERIVQDFAAYCDQLLGSDKTDKGGEDREQGYYYFTSIFLPGHEIELTWRADPFTLSAV